MLAGLWLAGPLWAADSSAELREIDQQYRRGDGLGALQRVDQALRAWPGDAGLRLLQGVLLADAGRRPEAAQVLEALTQAFPELPEPYNNLAVLRAADGQLAQARGLLETALRLDPQYRTAHENLGDVLVRLAHQAYVAAAGPRAEPLLQTKLRLARELAAVR